jgi:hypothetical protein
VSDLAGLLGSVSAALVAAGTGGAKVATIRAEKRHKLEAAELKKKHEAEDQERDKEHAEAVLENWRVDTDHFLYGLKGDPQHGIPERKGVLQMIEDLQRTGSETAAAVSELVKNVGDLSERTHALETAT